MRQLAIYLGFGVAGLIVTVVVAEVVTKLTVIGLSLIHTQIDTLVHTLSNPSAQGMEGIIRLCLYLVGGILVFRFVIERGRRG
jgi:hypothetical protein